MKLAAKINHRGFYKGHKAETWRYLHSCFSIKPFSINIFEATGFASLHAKSQWPLRLKLVTRQPSKQIKMASNAFETVMKPLQTASKKKLPGQKAFIFVHPDER
jgi:hypothetical protein